MGRESVCDCDWAGTTVEVKALLETGKIILRGGLRKRIPFGELQQVEAQDGRLRFCVGREQVQLHLGLAAAEWAETITSPPPSLARKLGISDKTIVRTIGEVTGEALNEALAQASGVEDRDATLIVACVDSEESLHNVLQAARPQTNRGIPIWIVYAKGQGPALNETAIRSLLRDNGLMDTKVASVSAKLTALRFSLRKAE